MKPILGIVGGIGSGKSYVASLFAKQGGYVIDADRLGHLALLNTEVKKQVKEQWGDAVFNDKAEVDRKKAGKYRLCSTPGEGQTRIDGLPVYQSGHAGCNPPTSV